MMTDNYNVDTGIEIITTIYFDEFVSLAHKILCADLKHSTLVSIYQSLQFRDAFYLYHYLANIKVTQCFSKEELFKKMDDEFEDWRGDEKNPDAITAIIYLRNNNIILVDKDDPNDFLVAWES